MARRKHDHFNGSRKVRRRTSWKKPRKARKNHPVNLARKAAHRHKPWLYVAFGPFCAGCRGAFRYDDMTVDHLWPLTWWKQYVYGNISDPINLQLMCMRCNKAKGQQKLTQFTERVKVNHYMLKMHESY